MLKVGVIADTHIPDRAQDLHPGLIPALETAGVDLILHAGDICLPDVLTQLEKVAPVQAVRGNRDWFFQPSLPWILRYEWEGISVALVHGHGSLWQYSWDKVQYLFKGYQFYRYHNVVTGEAGSAQVVIFGHTHTPENRHVEGRLLFNPGSACHGVRRSVIPSFGILQFDNGQVNGEIRRLEGWKLTGGRWVEGVHGNKTRKK